MPAREARLRECGTVKQSLKNTHYQVELGNELNHGAQIGAGRGIVTDAKGGIRYALPPYKKL